MTTISGHSFNIGPYGKNLMWNYLANWDQTFMEWFLDGPLSEVYQLDPKSIQDGRHQWT